MKKILLGAALAAFCASPVLAQDAAVPASPADVVAAPPAADAPAPAFMMREIRSARIGINLDDVRREAFLRLDADKDSAVTSGEYSSVVKQPAADVPDGQARYERTLAIRKSMFARLDADKSGGVSMDEWMAHYKPAGNPSAAPAAGNTAPAGNTPPAE